MKTCGKCCAVIVNLGPCPRCEDAPYGGNGKSQPEILEEQKKRIAKLEAMYDALLEVACSFDESLREDYRR